MQKTLDKILKICYNKYVIKRDYKIKIFKGCVSYDRQEIHKERQVHHDAWIG